MRLVVAFCVSAALLCAAPRVLSLEDLARIHNVSDPQVSPDGQWIAYTVGTVDAKDDKGDTDIWMVSWDGSKSVRLTYSLDSENSPRWSPDGRYISFVSGRPAKPRGPRSGCSTAWAAKLASSPN